MTERTKNTILGIIIGVLLLGGMSLDGYWTFQEQDRINSIEDPVERAYQRYMTYGEFPEGGFPPGVIPELDKFLDERQQVLGDKR